MIIAGYPCIGKSSIENFKSDDRTYSPTIIDLESSHFKNRMKRAMMKMIEPDTEKVSTEHDVDIDIKPNWHWEYSYCLLASLLSDSGFCVFISTHQPVLDTLDELSIEYSLCYPDLDLKDIWIERARNRYGITLDDKDSRAYNRIANHYDEDIQNLMNRNCMAHYVISREDMHDNLYDLRDILIKYYVLKEVK